MQERDERLAKSQEGGTRESLNGGKSDHAAIQLNNSQLDLHQKSKSKNRLNLKGNVGNAPAGPVSGGAY